MKRIVISVLSFVFLVYGIGCAGAFTYFSWKYAQQVGFMQWLVGGEVVPLIHSFAWPLYLAEWSSPNFPESQMQDKDDLDAHYECVDKARRRLDEPAYDACISTCMMAYSRDSKGGYCQECRSEFALGVESFKKCAQENRCQEQALCHCYETKCGMLQTRAPSPVGAATTDEPTLLTPATLVAERPAPCLSRDKVWSAYRSAVASSDIKGMVVEIDRIWAMTLSTEERDCAKFLRVASSFTGLLSCGMREVWSSAQQRKDPPVDLIQQKCQSSAALFLSRLSSLPSLAELGPQLALPFEFTSSVVDGKIDVRLKELLEKITKSSNMSLSQKTLAADETAVLMAFGMVNISDFESRTPNQFPGSKDFAVNARGAMIAFSQVAVSPMYATLSQSNIQNVKRIIENACSELPPQAAAFERSCAGLQTSISQFREAR